MMNQDLGMGPSDDVFVRKQLFEMLIFFVVSVGNHVSGDTVGLQAFGTLLLAIEARILIQCNPCGFCG